MRKIESEVIERGEIITDEKTGETTNLVEYKKGSVNLMAATGNLDMDLSIDAWVVSSDISNKKKFIIVGGYHWNSLPVSRFTDALSIGWPTSPGWYLPTSGGNVTQFPANDYWVNKANSKNITYKTTTSTPDDASQMPV